jgi:hypothetical protein
MDKIEELIQAGQKFNFRNNSHSASHGNYTRASEELLSWIATVEDFILNTYGEESAAYKLYLTFDRKKLNDYELDDFQKQMTVLNGSLKACKNITPKSKNNPIDDHQIIQLIKNSYFWAVLIFVSGGAFGLGLRFGSSKFDKEKNEFYETTKSQEIEIISLKKYLVTRDSVAINKGKTLETILNVLRNDLNYFVPEPQIINAKNFGVPQQRERIYIVGFRKDSGINEFEYPNPIKKKVKFADIKEKKVPPTKYFLSTQYVQTLVNHKARHEGKGNGFGYAIIPDDGIANAIVVGGMGRERNLVIDKRITDYTPTTHIKGVVNRDGIRKMTPREWARLQGFPDKFVIPVADASAYKQFGNSVAVPAIQATARKILELILEK